MELITYEEQHQERLNDFFREVFTELGWGYDPQDRHLDTIQIPDTYMEGGCFWLLVENDRIVGTVAVKRIKDGTAELKRLYILKEYRSQHLGELLMSTALSFAQKSGFSSICADTRADRSASIYLMRKNGFVEIQQYNDNPFADLFFEKKF